MRARLKTGDEAGFTLIEVVVAMAVFAVLAAISLGILLNTTDVASDNIHRTAATNLVSTQLEAARSLDAQSIPDGRQVTTPSIGGFAYTVTQDATYIGANSTSVCAGSGDTLAYKLVTVRVTWPNMGSIKAVRGDTLRAVGIGSDGLDATKGTLALLISGSTGQPVPGVVITLTPGNLVRTTGDDGCAVFTGLTPGSYAATANQAGYVGTANTQSVALSATATAGGVTRSTLLYDTERSANVTFDAPVGAIVPVNLPLRFGDSYVTESTLPLCTATSTSACTTAVPGTVNNLFPESYQFKIGTCVEATASTVSADLRPASTNNSTVLLPVGAANVKVVLAAAPTVGIVGRTITFTHLAQTGCTAGETYTMTSATAGSTLVLPYGQWTVSAPVFNSAGKQVSIVQQTLTLSPAAKTTTTTLQVAL